MLITALTDIKEWSLNVPTIIVKCCCYIPKTAGTFVIKTSSRKILLILT